MAGQFKFYLTLGVVALLLLGWLTLLFTLLDLLLPMLLSLLVVLFLHYRLMMLVMRMMVFPGSLKPFQKQIENHMGKMLSKKYLEGIVVLKTSLKQLLPNSQGRQVQETEEEEDAIDNKEALEMLDHSIKVLRRLESKKQLNKRQVTLLAVQVELIYMMKDVQVQVQKEQATLIGGQAGTGGSVYAWLARDDEDLGSTGLFRSFGGEHGRVAEQEGLWMIEAMERVAKEYSSMAEFEFSLLNGAQADSIGDLNYMRAELEGKYQAEEVQIGHLGGMLIHGGEHCVVFCLPNAGYYEQMYY